MFGEKSIGVKKGKGTFCVGLDVQLGKIESALHAAFKNVDPGPVREEISEAIGIAGSLKSQFTKAHQHHQD
jgi:hypothetical protein